MSCATRCGLGACGLGAYGLVTGATGVLLGLGVGSGAASAPAVVAARPVPARPAAVQPVVPVPPARPVVSARSGATRAMAAISPAGVDRGVEAGSPFQPTQLVLPGGVTAPVRASGLHPDGSLVIPDDPAVVGWWTGGALAGDAFGGVVVAGHVDSARYGLGVMVRLRALRTGQVVELRTGGRRLGYRVTARASLPQAELVVHTDTFRQDGPHRLVLITCGGVFDPVRHRYRDNLVIYAQPMPLPPAGGSSPGS